MPRLPHPGLSGWGKKPVSFISNVTVAAVLPKKNPFWGESEQLTNNWPSVQHHSVTYWIWVRQVWAADSRSLDTTTRLTELRAPYKVSMLVVPEWWKTDNYFLGRSLFLCGQKTFLTSNILWNNLDISRDRALGQQPFSAKSSQASLRGQRGQWPSRLSFGRLVSNLYENTLKL